MLIPLFYLLRWEEKYDRIARSGRAKLPVGPDQAAKENIISAEGGIGGKLTDILKDIST
jgi:hypothetical protein